MVLRRLTMFGSAVVPARVVSPEDFGVVAMAMVFVGFVELLRDLGTGVAIVQREVISPELLSSIFWFNLEFSAIVAFALVAAAEGIAILVH
jgi:O-antigen/teichoic acid export membrane protein